MSVAHASLLYARVETLLAGEVTDGDLKIGDQLATEDSLIGRFGVSRITVRRAIQNLVSRGLVEIRRGKGTFVTAPKIMQDLKDLSGFVEDMHILGSKPTARVISKEIVTANATVARQLALTRGERVVRIRRVRLADGVPTFADGFQHAIHTAIRRQLRLPRGVKRIRRFKASLHESGYQVAG